MNELVRNRIDNTLVDYLDFRDFWRMVYVDAVRRADAFLDRDYAGYNAYVMAEVICGVCAKYKLNAAFPVYFPADYFPPDVLKQLQDIRALRKHQQEVLAQVPQRMRLAEALFE